MESSKKSTELDFRIKQVLDREVSRGDHLLLGLSGGVDSVVLLSLLHAAAPARGFKLSCVHVDHRISPNSAKWAEFCAELCRNLGVALKIETVDLAPFSEFGLEGAARAARYAAFARHQADFLVLAQHQDDQAETLLMQLFRGAGLKGVSAMPDVRDRGRTRLLRPMLDVPRSQIERHARSRGLSWITDESNLDTGFSRNFLRHEVLPRIEQGFPAYRQTLSRASRHFAEAQSLLDEIAADDADRAVVAGRLNLRELAGLSPARSSNLLRFFLAGQGLRMPSSARLAEMLRVFRFAGRDAEIAICHDGFELRVFRGWLEALPLREPPPKFSLAWGGLDEFHIPGLGLIRFERAVGSGIKARSFDAARVTARSRVGGERLRPDRLRPSRTLKNLWQELGVAPWERRRVPLLYVEERLIWVPGIGIDADFQAASGEAALIPRWIANYSR